MTIDWSKAPEGATHYDPVDQNFLREVGPALLMYRMNVGWIVPHHCQYAHTVEETVRPLMIRPVWNGEGLPPVGTVCEFQFLEESNQFKPELLHGHKVTVIAHYAGVTGRMVAAFTFDYEDGNARDVESATEAHFRPIRTAEQIAADERELALTDMCVLLGKDPSRPGVREMAGVLFDAGYRKQVSQ